MDWRKTLEVIDTYKGYFVENDIEPLSFPHNAKPISDKDKLQHCHGMLSKMQDFVLEGRMEKAFRWLGFIQGCLWSIGIYSLDDLKNHNRPDPKIFTR
jgi:hypothetical protein